MGAVRVEEGGWRRRGGIGCVRISDEVTSQKVTIQLFFSCITRWAPLRRRASFPFTASRALALGGVNKLF